MTFIPDVAASIMLEDSLEIIDFRALLYGQLTPCGNYESISVGQGVAVLYRGFMNFRGDVPENIFPVRVFEVHDRHRFIDNERTPQSFFLPEVLSILP